MSLKKIIDAITDVIPMGGLAKSLLKGAGSLLFKKAAKVVGIDEKVVDNIFVEADKIAEYDHEVKMALIAEEKERRTHELEFYGKFTQLDVTTQKLRARIRPLLSFGLIGLFVLIVLIKVAQQMFPASWAGFEFMIEIPSELISISKVVIGFWFGGRSLEKIVGLMKNNA